MNSHLLVIINRMLFDKTDLCHTYYQVVFTFKYLPISSSLRLSIMAWKYGWGFPILANTASTARPEGSVRADDILLCRTFLCTKCI